MINTTPGAISNKNFLSGVDPEAYYRRHGWSGCEGSTWDCLPPATRDAWAHAARVAAELAIVLEMMEALGGYWDHLYTHMPSARAPEALVLTGCAEELRSALKRCRTIGGFSPLD